MEKNNASIAEAYYTLVGEKNLAAIEKYLHPDIRFIGPLAKMSGKSAFLEATKNFMAMFNTLTIRAKFGSKEQAMIVYDVELPEPIGQISASVLLTFCDGLIAELELFYDARPFEAKKAEIFSTAGS